MLVGEEKDLMPTGSARGLFPESPGQHRTGVRRGADHATVASDEGLQRRGRVHVGHRHHPAEIGHLAEDLPGFLDGVDVGHVRHRTAGVQVGKDHLLIGTGEDVGGFGHEVDTAEHDEFRFRLRSSDP